MISVLLIAAAAAVLYGVDVQSLKGMVEKARKVVSPRVAAAALLVAVALALLPTWRSSEPTPAPDSGPFSLAGSFVGPTASEDAATIGALLCELADEIEYDGAQSEPAIRQGVQIDHLRKVARLLRCKGESIGDRQPKARDQIANYLESHVGTDGGPLTPESRAAWVSAFRETGKAATDAAQ